MKPVLRATIYATALGMYELHLNHTRVGEDYFTPGWTTYSKRLQYQTYEVTHQLKAGENVLGAYLGDGWYLGHLGWNKERKIFGSTSALLLSFTFDMLMARKRSSARMKSGLLHQVPFTCRIFIWGDL